jgi:hypothetical protein
MPAESESQTRKTRIDPFLEAAGWDVVRYEEGMDLWLLEMMIRNRVLQPQESASALRLMLAGKCWLPRPECEKLIRKWESDE